MIINHNIPALNTYSRLSSNNQGVARALEKLSSGMRINRAADDAAGLAISEKMRSQIKGLQQATRNVQDGISLIQTAEGALTETHSILQRIRELTVQAANDTYTANDRMEIQREINQLQEEMNRISATTQFNAKNLLDGTCAALVSTDKSSTRVFMRGGLRATDTSNKKVPGGGNYKLDIIATPGKNQVQKTDIFKINRSGEQLTNLELGTTGLNDVTASGLQYGSYNVSTTANAASGVAGVDSTIANTQNYLQGQLAGITPPANPATSVFGDGGVALNADNETKNMSILAEITDISGDDITYKVSYYSYNMDGTLSASALTETVTIDANAGGNFTLDGVQIDITGGNAVNTTGLAVGDKSVFTVNAAVAADTTYDKIAISGTLYGADNSAPLNITGTGWNFTNDALNNTAPEFNICSIYQEVADPADQSQYYDDSLLGTGYTGSVKLAIDGFTTGDGAATPNLKASFTFEDGYGKIAGNHTRLYDIDKFWDANGNFILERPKTITLVQGNGTKVNVVLTSADTIDTLKEKINTAIKLTPPKGLGQSEIVGGPPNDEKFVSYVTGASAQDSGFETVPGTFIIRSAMPGKDGEINIVGDDSVMTALSLMTLQNAESNKFTVTVTDAHDPSNIIASDVVITDNNLVGIVHENVDVQFSATTGLTASWDDNTKNFELTGGAANQEETFIHLADNSMIFQVGANQQQDVMAAIGDMSVRALGIENIQVASNYLCNQALAKIDEAIGRVSAERSKLGAIQNRLDHTYNNLTVTAENLTAAESRIRDVDMAQEMLNFTKYNILSQASTAMLAQANQLPQSVLQLLR